MEAQLARKLTELARGVTDLHLRVRLQLENPETYRHCYPLRVLELQLAIDKLSGAFARHQDLAEIGLGLKIILSHMRWLLLMIHGLDTNIDQEMVDALEDLNEEKELMEQDLLPSMWAGLNFTDPVCMCSFCRRRRPATPR